MDKTHEESKLVVIAAATGTTKENLAGLKSMYGDKVKVASLPLDDNGEEYLQVIVRVPDRKTMSEFEKWMEKNPDKSKEILINACLLTRKDEVKANDDLFAGAYDAIAGLIPIRKAIVKNF